ncbi:MAG: hypothetical protein O7A63_02480, partial [Acidobacteria bacterium]|nr:hypothetical protein [Acidobacteriota bacterium]
MSKFPFPGSGARSRRSSKIFSLSCSFVVLLAVSPSGAFAASKKAAKDAWPEITTEERTLVKVEQDPE